jgi:hypothetical protein
MYEIQQCDDEMSQIDYSRLLKLVFDCDFRSNVIFHTVAYKKHI